MIWLAAGFAGWLALVYMILKANHNAHKLKPPRPVPRELDSEQGGGWV